MHFEPSAYQTAIFDWWRDGTGHGVVSAVAGSGKSKVLEESAKHHVPWTNRVLNMAFNKHIAVAMLPRMPKNVDVKTFNAFGWEICRRNVRGVVLEGRKDTMILNKIIDPGKERGRYQRVRRPLLSMVSLLKALGERNIDKWQDVSNTYSVEFGEIKADDRFEDLLRDLYEHSINEVEMMNFDDQIFQPIYREWDLPAFDNIMVDEVQDASPVQIELCVKMAESGGRILMVGDEDQSIYLFRGAHPDAMAQMAGALGATSLPLNICYRCPDAVIQAAQRIVPRIEAPSPNPNGKGLEEDVKTETFLKGADAGDMVLCRTTAPLIKRCLQLLREGRKASVKGRDLVEQVIRLVEQLHGDSQQLENEVGNYRRTGKAPLYGLPIEEFRERIHTYRATRIQQLQNQNRENEAQAVEDRCDTIAAFADDSDFVGQIIAKVEDVTSEDAEDGVTFMTGHKAKGLEAKNVWILRPDLMPHPRAKTEIAQRQERNLEYVSITRCRGNLRWVQKEQDEK